MKNKDGNHQIGKKKALNISSNALIRLVIALDFALVAVCVAAFFTENRAVFYVCTGITVVLLFWTYGVVRKMGQAVSGFYRSVIKRLSMPNSEIYNQFRLPVVLLQGNNVVWYNSLFRSLVLQGNDLVGPLPEEILSQAERSALRLSEKVDVAIQERKFTVYSSAYQDKGTTTTVLYFVDVTDLKNIEREYKETRPVVAVFSIDSYDELTKGMVESDQAKFKGAIDREIELFTGGLQGVTKTLKNHRYISLMDERGFAQLKETKMAVLDRVRNLSFEGGIKATLSIGIARGEDTYKACEASAQQALEMAQGRGGDQAAIKSGDTYEFFGGVSSAGVEKRTKVRTRMVATALAELIRGSDRVFIMGHRFGDIDSLGASYALWNCVVSMEKEAHIVIDPKSHLAQSLIQKIKNDAGQRALTSAADAKERMTRQSLLIICDTHRRDFVESPDLYDSANTTVVIDHHRKNTDFIENSVIFYHEPHASSACEMVAELLQYIDPAVVGKSQADALLAGIMLDTRNFVLRTGVRTFEASAFLRSRGADPVTVKKLFADSFQVYRERAALVSSAEFYSNYAVAFAPADLSVSRVAASQAADELLNIENVDASFVLFSTGDVVNVSARSLGKVNVQIIMEALGGGGHHTMAAAQIPQTTVEQAKKKLLQILKQFSGKDE